MWDHHTAGSDLDKDGVSGEDTPALLNILDPLDGVETNGIDGNRGEIVTLTDVPELEDEQSPVEEAGHEAEGVDDEELGSTVEEGEEAALALDVPPTESELQWLSLEQVSVCHSKVNHLSSLDSGSNDVHEHEEVSASVPKSNATEESSTAEWDIHCPSPRTDNCQSDNLA